MLTILAVVFAASSIWFVVESETVRRFRVVRRLRAARRYAIAELPESTTGRVVGSARPLHETLTSPLTGRACVYYEVKVSDRSKGESGHLFSERRGTPFVLLDLDGRAIVDPEHVELALDFDVHTTSGTGDDPTPVEATLLKRHQQRGQGWLFNRKLRYDEAVIAPGEIIAVCGSCVREPDPDAASRRGYRGETPTRIRLSGSRRYPLLISDKPSSMK